MGCGCNVEIIDIHTQLGDRYLEYSCKYFFPTVDPDVEWDTGILPSFFVFGRCSNIFRIIISKINIQLGHLLWNCSQVNAIDPQHTFRKWLGAIKIQAITWANVAQMTSLGHNELIQMKTSTTHYQAILQWVNAGSCPVISLLFKELSWGDLGMKYPGVSKLSSV